jgi:hypothetical protein
MQGEKRGVDEIEHIDFAGDVVRSINANKEEVQYADRSMENLIRSAKPTELLRVKLTINSPIKIVGVEKLDAAWFAKQQG